LEGFANGRSVAYLMRVEGHVDGIDVFRQATDIDRGAAEAS
jgi:hypothetical protein